MPSVRLKLALFLGLALPVWLLAAGPAAAADTQRVPLGKGTLSAPKAQWEANGVPRGSILIDLRDASGGLIATYGKATSSLAPRKIDATGFRPRSLPTRHALLAGATGSHIHKVRIHMRGGAKRTVRTVPSPSAWGVANRLFAFGFTIPAAHRNAMRAVIEIEGLNAAGKVIASQRSVPTSAY